MAVLRRALMLALCQSESIEKMTYSDTLSGAARLWSCELLYINPLLRHAALTCKAIRRAICLYARSMKDCSSCRDVVDALCPFKRRGERVIHPCKVRTSHMSSKLLSAAHHLLDDDSNSEGHHAIVRDDACHAWLRDTPVKALHPNRQEQPVFISLNSLNERYNRLSMPKEMLDDVLCAGSFFAWGYPAR